MPKNILYLETKLIVLNLVYKNIIFYQSLVGSVVIDIELGRENHGSIPHNCDREGAKTT
jgi:hypothetical protein